MKGGRLAGSARGAYAEVVPVVRLRGADIYYEQSGDGVPVLGIHGTPSSSVMWADAADRISEQARCIVYDRRGFGRSTPAGPGSTLDLDDHVEDAAALLGVLGAESPVVIGRSTGGQIALALALSHPEAVRALVLLEPAVFTIDPIARAWADDLRARVLTRSSTDPSRAAELVVREALGDEVWDGWPIELRRFFASASSGVAAEINGTGLDLSSRPAEFDRQDLADLRLPVLIVSAADSLDVFRVVSDRLAAALPAAQLARVGGGHVIDPAHDDIRAFIGARAPT